MKKMVMAVLAGAILALATSAASSIRPHARRTNGDPDEFQCRQVLDEGLLVRDYEIITEGWGKPERSESIGRRPKPVTQIGAENPIQRPVFSIRFSGKTAFLER